MRTKLLRGVSSVEPHDYKSMTRKIPKSANTMKTTPPIPKAFQFFALLLRIVILTTTKETPAANTRIFVKFMLPATFRPFCALNSQPSALN
jgi:hypothetical protein